MAGLPFVRRLLKVFHPEGIRQPGSVSADPRRVVFMNGLLCAPSFSPRIVHREQA
jgi:hypothetical protein